MWIPEFTLVPKRLPVNDPWGQYRCSLPSLSCTLIELGVNKKPPTGKMEGQIDRTRWPWYIMWNGKLEKVVKLMAIQRFLASHVFAYMVSFDETNRDDYPHNYYMEREWRVLGNVQFSLEDVFIVILLEEFLRRFRADVPDYYRQVTFI